ANGAVNKHVAIVRKQISRTKRRARIVQSTGRSAVAGAIEQARILLLLILRLVDRREKLHAIAHRNHHFVLGVTALDIVSEFSLLLSHLPGLGKRKTSYTNRYQQSQ